VARRRPTSRGCSSAAVACRPRWTDASLNSATLYSPPIPQKPSSTLGLDRGENHWLNAAHLLQPLVARLLRRQSDPAEVLDHLAAAIAEHRAGLLTHTVGEQAAPVQLMGLYQTKGREADATIVVLRSNDFYGTERYEPFDTGSRLLYVVLTRARKRTVILLFGDDPKPLVAPLVKLAS
jgi:DNA helicase-2/ATP-dependent DNA helicase PcrA